ncbi:MAG TPA: citramalate synthase [Phycisphaerae bacterium]|nr:citramalate synthase [Phycisphaerae bacterium]
MNNKSDRIEIYDTTLRDGAQGCGVNFSLEDKLVIAEMLDSRGVDYIEGGYPLSNPKDEAFFDECLKRGLENSKLVAFGMTRKKAGKAFDDAGMQALLNCSASVVNIVGKSWQLHTQDVLSVSSQENLEMISDSISLLAGAGREVIFDAEHFFDGYLADRSFALDTARAAFQAGAGRIVLCDTNGGTMPENIAKIVQDVCSELPDAIIGIHCHNDCDLATANTLQAVSAGATHVHVTVNGIGERCGNTDLVPVVANLALKYSHHCLGKDGLAKLSEVSRFVYEISNMNPRDDQPYVGPSAFAHKGGMHVHAVNRNPVTYEHIDPELVGNARRILVSELSGTSNIAVTVPAKFDIAEDKAAQKKILDAVCLQESEGYQFESAEGSYDMLIRRTLGSKWYNPLWQLDHYRCMILRRKDMEPSTEATVKILIGDMVEHTVAEGDGPVDSLYRALFAALRGHFETLDELHLVDYMVRVVNTAAETAAKVRVVIEWRNSRTDRAFGTVGVSENIIDASWLALVDAIEYMINEQ